MKKATIVIFAILLVIVLVVTLKNSVSINIGSKNTNSSNNAASAPTQINKNSLGTKENTQGSVSVAITPLNLNDNSPTWNFEVSLNTHSGALNADITTVSELVDDRGKLYKPVSWDGPAPGGHHIKGILKFNPILPKPKSIELKIKNVGGVEQRNFKWNL